MDAEAVPWRIRSPVTGLFSEARFPDYLNLTSMQHLLDALPAIESTCKTQNHNLALIRVLSRNSRLLFICAHQRKSAAMFWG
jgi:hypothetical protein